VKSEWYLPWLYLNSQEGTDPQNLHSGAGNENYKGDFNCFQIAWGHKRVVRGNQYFKQRHFDSKKSNQSVEILAQQIMWNGNVYV
jgi:hypothetical protein